jgi:hypothetical protein
MDKDYFILLGFDGCNRIRVRISSSGGVLSDFVCQYETLHDDSWLAITRYDCAHGQPFHRDVLLPGGGKEKEFLDMDSLKFALDYALQDLKSRWKWYRERFFSHRRQ